MGPLPATLVSALLLAAALPPWDLDELLFVALVPWLFAVSRARGLRAAALQGFWLAAGLSVLSAWWLAVAIREFLGLPWPLAFAGLLVYAALLAQPHLWIFGPLVRRCGPVAATAGRDVGVALWLALAYTALDWGMPRLFDVGLGYGLHDAGRLRQLAALGGVDLLTGLVVSVNVLLWRALESARSHGAARALAPALAAAVGLGGAWLHGAASEAAWRERAGAADATLAVAVAQGSVPNAVRVAWARGDDRAAERQLSAYTLLSETLVARATRPDLLVWPEAAFPGAFRRPGTKLQRGREVKFERQMLRLGLPIVFGAYDVEEEAAEAPRLYNALFMITPPSDRAGGLGSVQRYRKHRLLPFAETLPGVGESSWARRALPRIGFFAAGPGATLFRHERDEGRAFLSGPLVCSESLSTAHVLEAARKGSELILNVGSDGWFGDFGEPELHLAIARLRSVEARLPQVRAANSGISALIGPGGEIVARTRVGEERLLEGRLPLVGPSESLVTAWGDWVGPAAAAVALAAMLLDRLLVRGPRGG